MGCQPCGGRSQVLGGKEKGSEQRALGLSGGGSLCWQGSSSSFLHAFSQHDWKRNKQYSTGYKTKCRGPLGKILNSTLWILNFFSIIIVFLNV